MGFFEKRKIKKDVLKRAEALKTESEKLMENLKNSKRSLESLKRMAEEIYGTEKQNEELKRSFESKYAMVIESLKPYSERERVLNAEKQDLDLYVANPGNEGMFNKAERSIVESAVVSAMDFETYYKKVTLLIGEIAKVRETKKSQVVEVVEPAQKESVQDKRVETKKATKPNNINLA